MHIFFHTSFIFNKGGPREEDVFRSYYNLRKDESLTAKINIVTGDNTDVVVDGDKVTVDKTSTSTPNFIPPKITGSVDRSSGGEVWDSNVKPVSGKEILATGKIITVHSIYNPFS